MLPETRSTGWIFASGTNLAWQVGKFSFNPIADHFHRTGDHVLGQR